MIDYWGTLGSAGYSHFHPLTSSIEEPSALDSAFGQDPPGKLLLRSLPVEVLLKVREHAHLLLGEGTEGRDGSADERDAETDGGLLTS